ncbi:MULTISPECIES: hypothetical protein [Planktothrix]|uniref:hypothetical protein n=1 Tax=Planktothrix TaxID=54304 RepID=UPI0004167DD5|nr:MULTISPECIES: hypothetical protein [Planktothrix]
MTLRRSQPKCLDLRQSPRPFKVSESPPATLMLIAAFTSPLIPDNQEALALRHTNLKERSPS